MTKLPQDFEAALETAGLADYFAECTGAHQREYLNWIKEAKRAETRQARIAKAMEMLAARRAKESTRDSA